MTTKYWGYTGSSGWDAWYASGQNSNNEIAGVFNGNSPMPETGYVTQIAVYAAGSNGYTPSAQLFLNVGTSSSASGTIHASNTFTLSGGNQSMGGQHWNYYNFSAPGVLIPSGSQFMVGIWTTPSAWRVWSVKNKTYSQWDDGYVSTAPGSGGGFFGSHNIYGNQAIGAYIAYTPAAPIISSLSKTSGLPNSTFTISGYALKAVSAVKINGVACTFSITSDTVVSVTVAGTATTGSVTVTNPYGTTTGPTFTVQGAPTVTGMTPTSGTFGSTFTVTGHYFTGLTGVKLNGTTCTYVVNSDTSVTITVPTNATQGAVDLTNAYGTTNAGTFTPLAAPKPSGLTPTSGAFSSTFTVSGHYFTGVSGVTLNGTSCTYTVNSDTQVTVTVPASSTQGAVVLTNPYGTGNAGTFTPTSTPVFSAMTPTSGGAGSTTTITGHYLYFTTGVTVNGATASFTIVSDAEIDVVVPISATTGSVVITTQQGSVNAGTFTVNNSPGITSFSPSTGYAGTVISLVGVHFTGVTAATINGTTASFSVTDDTDMTVTIPVAATTGPMIVTNASGSTTVGTITVLGPHAWDGSVMEGAQLLVYQTSTTSWVAPVDIEEYNSGTGLWQT